MYDKYANTVREETVLLDANNHLHFIEIDHTNTRSYFRKTTNLQTIIMNIPIMRDTFIFET